MVIFRRIVKSSFTLAMLHIGLLCAQVNVTTQHNDIGRTGQNTNEVILTPQNVSAGSFGKLFSVPVDGQVMAQPLYLSGVNIPGSGTHNIVFVATEHDSVYAIDADAPMEPLWQATLLDAAHGAQPGAIPEPSLDSGCTNISPEYGVSSTPVIDPATGTIYVAAVTSEFGYPVQRLHALDVTTGAEKFGAPTTISASVAGAGNGSSGGILSFDPKWHLQRAGLLLVNNNVYVAFGSHCDFAAYHGWLLGYNATTMQQSAAFVTSPNGFGGGVWMGGAGLAADTTSTSPRLFLPTGNGTFDATAPYTTNTMDYGDSLLQLTLNNGITVTDAFTPYNQAQFYNTDGDVSSGGVLILPDQSGPYKHLAVQLGKSGSVYIVNRDKLGGFSSASNNIVQEVDNQVTGMWGMPAYWNGNLYFWTAGYYLKQFQINNGVVSSSPIASSIEGTAGFGMTPSVSSNANTQGIVWTIDYSENPEILLAHDALNVGTTLYSSATNPARDSAGGASKFAVPTIANGKVYIGASGLLDVYGLAPAADFSLTTAPGPIVVTQNGNVTRNLSLTPLYGFSGSVTVSAAGLPNGVTASFTSTPTVTITASASAVPGDYPISLTATSGNIVHLVSASLQILSNTQPDFSLSAAPASINQVPGSLTVNGIILSQLNGFQGNPVFSVTGLPSGVSASVSKISASYYVLNLSSNSDTPLVSSTVTVTGTYGSLVRSAAFSLTVAANPSFPAVELIAINSSKCLTVNGNSLSAGTLVVQSTCSAMPGQIWNLEPVSANTYKIVSPNSLLALSVLNGSFSSGAAVVQNPYLASNGQQWLLQGTPWGYYYIYNADASQCLDVQGGSAAEGALIDQANCTGVDSQKWSAQPVHSTTQVDLSPYFNAYAIVTDGTTVTGSGLGLSYALSETNLGSSTSWNQNPFSFGSPNFPDAVVASAIALPAGQFSSLQFLALSVFGSQSNQTLQITYTDGSTSTVQQSFSDWGSPMDYPGESQALATSYRVAPNGQGSLGPWYIYGYSVPLNNTKTVQSFQLPPDPNIFVLAVTLVK